MQELIKLVEKTVTKEEPTEEEVQKQIRETLENFKGNPLKEKDLNIEKINEHTVKKRKTNRQ